MRAAILSIALALGVAVPVSSVVGQAGSTMETVAATAVGAVLEHLSLSSTEAIVHIDLSRLPTGLDKAAIAAGLRMSQAPQAEAVRCAPIEGRHPLKNCHIEGADVFLTVHSVTRSGQEADVEVEVQREWESAESRTVSSSGWSVRLARDGSDWSVVEILNIWLT